MKRSSQNQFESSSSVAGTWVGIGLLLMAALGFTISILSSNMAYKNGIDIHSVNAVRYSVSVVLLFLFQKIRGKQLKLPLRERYTSLSLGVTVFMMAVGYLGATQYIPVSLAVLIFYTSPFLVAVISRFTENEPITIIRLIAIIIAFIGLALALGIQSLATLNWLGVAFAFIGALGAAIFVSVSSLMIRTADNQAVNFHCLSAGAVLFVLFLFFTGGPEGSITQSSWLKLSLACIALAVAYGALLAGLEIIGPIKTSMLLNVEPILTITLAAVFLGERLLLIQFVGAGFVIVGIILITGGFGKKF